MASGLLPTIATINNQLVAPPGTRIAFNQAAPPLGWVAESGAAFNDCSFRLVTSAAGGTGGATAWSTWNFGGTVNANAFTLSVAQLPAHTHTVNDPGHLHTTNDPTHSHGIIDPGHSHTFSTSTGSGSGQPQGGASNSASASTNAVTTGVNVASAFTNVSINSTVTNINLSNTGSGSTITPSITTPQVKYTDFIIGIKS